MLKKKLIILIFIALSCMSAKAQQLEMVSFEETMETSALQYPVMDNNNVKCALVKVGIIAQNPRFEGVVKYENKDGEYWVYVPNEFEQFMVKSDNFLPLICKFDPVKSGFTYRAILQPKDANGGSANMNQQTAQSQQGEKISVQIPGTSQSITLVLVKPGSFEMGATKEQNSKEKDERPAHWVRITKPFYMGETPVTQAVWEAVMGYNPSLFTDPEKPVENITWRDAQVFINRLNSLTGKNFSLPTEAQWEYAARGGQITNRFRYSGSNFPSDIAWYESNSNGTSHKVKSLRPNELGLYDMSGNVWEMCQDYKQNYSKEDVTDPVVNGGGENRVRRGGAWSSSEDQLRNAYRRRLVVDDPTPDTGLRLVME